MSLLNPAAATTEATAAPLFGLSGPGVTMFISTAILALGLTRLDPTAIVQDLHAVGFGMPLMIAAFVAFAACATLITSTSNIYKFTRNPKYLAFFLPLASLSYFSLETAIASIVIYVTAMNLTVIRAEERELQNTHGEAYTAYRNAVPRWFA
jgi:Isoprenylcysteine carboxyl methyltransferase (ICMT) family